MYKKYNVVILGYGEMGHAMQFLLNSAHDVSIWDKFPQPGFKSAQLDVIIPQADYVLFCLPVNPHKDILTHIKPLLNNDCICLSIAKGLDESGLSAAQIFKDVLGEEFPYGLIYGPMISEEIRAGRYAFAQLGCSHNETCETTCELFKQTRLHLETTTDITGISWSVILKNVYAMLFGMADELKLGDNMRGFLAVEALRELDKIVLSMGADAGSSYDLAGLGDLMTTATSEDSHHHNLGRQLARGERSNIEGEGVHTLDMVIKHQLFKKEDYPLFNLTYDIVKKPHNVEVMLQEYITNK